MHSHSVYVCVCRPVITWLSACVSVCVCWVSTQLFHYFPFTSRTSRRPQQTGRWPGCWGATDWPSEVTGVKGWHQQQPHPETNHCVCLCVWMNITHWCGTLLQQLVYTYTHTYLHTHTAACTVHAQPSHFPWAPVRNIHLLEKIKR